MQAAAAQKAAQARPQAFFADQVVQVQQQEAAVRTQQAASANAGEVRVGRVAIAVRFDVAKQRAVLRVVFHDDGRAGLTVVVYRHMHLAQVQQPVQGVMGIAVVFVIAGRAGRVAAFVGVGVTGAVFGGLRQFKPVQVLQQFAFHLLQPGLQCLRLFRHGATHGGQGLLHQGAHGALAQVVQGVVTHAFQRAQGLRKRDDFGAQGLFGFVDAGALLGGQGAGFGFGQGLATGACEGEHHVPAVFVRALQPELPGLGKGLQHGKCLGFLRFVGLLNGAGLGAEVRAAQVARNIGLQGLGQLCHGPAQHTALACRQAQSAGALGGLKVVQVAQVWRHRPQGCGRLHGLAHEGCPPAAHFAQHKEVVVGLVHVQPELCGSLRAFLPDPWQGQILQLGGAGKTERGGVDGQAQLRGREGVGGHGGVQKPSSVCRWAQVVINEKCL